MKKKLFIFPLAISLFIVSAQEVNSTLQIQKVILQNAVHRVENHEKSVNDYKSDIINGV